MSGTTLRAASAPVAYDSLEEFGEPTWALRVPDPGCGFLTSNAARRNTWHVNRRFAATWRRSAWLRAKADTHQPRLQRARIVVVAHHRDRRVRDAGNLAPTAKAVVDGLVDAGLLPDDSDRHLIGPDLRTGDLVTKPAPAYLDVLVYRLARPTTNSAATPARSTQ